MRPPRKGVRDRFSGRRRVAASAVSVLVAVFMSGCAGFLEPPLQPITYETLTYTGIPPDARMTSSMDGMAIDSTTHLLYVADSTSPTTPGIDIFDISTLPARYLRTISTDGAVPNGLLIIPGLQRMYSGDDDGTVDVYDLNPASKTYQTIIASPQMGGTQGADLLDYDPRDNLVLVTNPDDGFMSEVDPTTNKVVRRVSNLDVIEGPTYDPVDGMVYVGAVDDNLLYKINPRTGTVVQRYPFNFPCEPHAIVINPHTNEGLVACADKDELETIAWNFTTGQLIRTFDLAGGSDLAVYDPVSNKFYVASSGYSPAEMAVFTGSSPITYLTSVPTSHKSHGVAYDEVHHEIFTFDGLLRQAGLWEFPDPTAHCSAQLTHCTAGR